MSKKIRKVKKGLGLIIASIGAGIVLTVVVPMWGWIIASGVALIYGGWYIMEHHHH